MQVLTTIEEFRHAKAALPGSWGLVPTMGFLHAGHLSLVKRARAENDHVAVSIFVNPTQFGPNEDLAAYPRDLDRDLSLLEALDVDLVFNPSPEVMYPPNYQTYVTVEDVTKYLEGASRPGHFRGVATVVAKLFNIVGAERAYFGQKDAQQTIVIKRMVQDLNMPDRHHHLPDAARSRRAGAVEPQHVSRRGASPRSAGALSGVVCRQRGFRSRRARWRSLAIDHARHHRSGAIGETRLRVGGECDDVAGVGISTPTPTTCPRQEQGRECCCRWRCAWASRG